MGIGIDGELFGNCRLFRYPKSDPAIIARYNQPLYVAVKTRQQVAAAGGEVTVDFYLINEKNVRGNHQ